MAAKKKDTHHNTSEEETKQQPSVIKDAALDDDGADVSLQADTSENSKHKNESSLSKKKVLEQLQKAEQDNKDLSDRLLRTMAEFENYRKRATREKEELVIYGIEKFARELLPVVDNFERACEQAAGADDLQAIVDGVEMILKQLNDALEKFNIRAFSSLGESFDPEKHDAMAQHESPDYDENIVSEEYQKGYFIGEKLLRPARVIVSKGRPSDTAT